MDLIPVSIGLIALAGLVYCCYATLGILKLRKVRNDSFGQSAVIQVFQWRLLLLVLGVVAAGMMAFKSWQMAEARTERAHRLGVKIKADYDSNAIWKAPDPGLILQCNQKDLILYGRQLIINTSDFLGPKGVIKSMSNGMNCQNCHLEAGTKPYGNNYGGVAANYPKFRARSGTEETISKRINDCIQRSLNGDSLQANSKEMKAIQAYILWLGQAVTKNKKPLGVGLIQLTPMNRPASPEIGSEVYKLKCQSCHGPEGKGLPRPESKGESYPPLWGEYSYNEAAGLFRISTFAGYVKANMPFGATADAPQLTDEEAWDVAAFVNSQPRPKHKYLNIDWPVISKKPFDHPFGPYADSFSTDQHKYGPYQPIIEYQTSNTK